MALRQTNATVTTSANPVFTLPAGSSPTQVTLNNAHNQPIYLGGSSAVTVSGTATSGLPLAANSTIQLNLNPGDQIWAIASAASGAGNLSIVYSA